MKTKVKLVRICSIFVVCLTILASCSTTSYLASESAEARYLRKLLVERPNIPPLRMWLLVDGGADPLGKNPEGEYLFFHIAKHLKNYRAFTAMLKRSEVDILFRDANDYNALHYAAQYNPHLEFLTELETKFPENMKTTPDNKSLLHLAVLNNTNEIIQYLIKQGLNVNGATSMGETPIHLAVRNARSKELISLLEDSGADIQQKDNFSNSLLHAAAYSDSPDLLGHFLAKDFNPQEKNNEGDTVLHIAARESQSIEFLQFAFQNITYISSLNNDNVSALQILQDRFDFETIISILQIDFDDPNNTLLQAQQSAIYELYTFFVLGTMNPDINPSYLSNLIKLIDLNEPFFNDTPLIHYAVRNFDSPEMLSLLIDLGASLTQTNYYGETVLHWAARYSNNPDTLALIIDQAPELLTIRETINGSLPIHYAAASGSLPAFVTIAKRGGNLNLPNDINQTPRLLAQKNRSIYGSILIWTY